MPSLRRWIRHQVAHHAARPHLAQYRAHVERILGGPVTWRHVGGHRRDVVYHVVRGSTPVGVLRHVAPDAPLPQRPLHPYVFLPPAERIRRDADTCRRGAAHGLTPQLLWQGEHALLCAYVDAPRLHEHAARTGGALLPLVTGALPRLAALHAAGISHMDMSPFNILCVPGRPHVFIDFEHAPAPGLSFEQQCLYDYLRLLESTWKFLRDDERAAIPSAWATAFRAAAPAAVRQADLAPLRPALQRILAVPAACAAIADSR